MEAPAPDLQVQPAEEQHEGAVVGVLVRWGNDHTPDVDHLPLRFDHQRARLFGRQWAGRQHEATGAHYGRSVPAQHVHGSGVEGVVLAAVVELLGPSPPPADDGIVAQAVGEVALVVTLGDREAQRSGRDHPHHEAIEGRGVGLLVPGSRPTVAH